MKWNLWRAALYGLIASMVTLITSNAVNGWQELSVLWQGRPGQIIAFLLVRLVSFPMVFVLVAFVHNLFVKTPS